MTTLDELEKLAGDALPHWGKNALPMLGGNPNAIDKTAPFVNAANPETILLLCRVARAAGELEDSAADPKATPFSSADYRAAVERQRLALEALRTVLAELKGEV